MKRTITYVLIVCGLALAGCGGASRIAIDYREAFKHTSLLVSASPAPESVDVGVDANVILGFAENMDQTTVEDVFSLTKVEGNIVALSQKELVNAAENGERVEGAFSWPDLSHMIFTPDAPMDHFTVYLVRLNGNVNLSSEVDPTAADIPINIAYSFMTRPSIGPTPYASVIGVSPQEGTQGVSIETTIRITFDDSVDPDLIDSTLMNGGTVNGTIAWNSDYTVLTFTPDNFLAFDTKYFISVSGPELISPFVSTFTTQQISYPTVVSIDPADGAQDVLVDTVVEVVFSKEMDTSSVEAAFSLTRRIGSQVVVGQFAWFDGDTRMVFTPDNVLDGNRFYDVLITTGAQDTEGFNLQADFVSEFKTENIVFPEVNSVDPLDTAVDVSVNTTVEIIFSKAMNTASVEGAFSLDDGGAVAGTFAWAGGDKRMTFTPDNPLDNDTEYTVTVTTTAEDATGLNLQNQFDSTFTTEIDYPQVQNIDPADGEQNVPVNTTVEVVFTKSMNTASVEGAFSLTKRQGGVDVTGTFAWFDSNTRVVFTPDASLTNKKWYDVEITTAAQDTDGNNMQAVFDSSFKIVN